MKIRLSLKAIFLIVTLAAVAIFYVPVHYQAYCDSYGGYQCTFNPVDELIDIQGRNKNQSFEDVIQNVPLTSIEPSNNPRLGRWKIEFRTNLNNYVKLRKYEILRFRESRG